MLEPRTLPMLRANRLLLLAILVSPGTALAAGIVGHVLQETVTVPVGGSSVVSSTTLDSSTTYKIRASGTMEIAPGLNADAEYAQFSSPIDNTMTGNVDLGIGIDDSVNDSDKFPSWGPYDPAHEYVIDLVGSDAAISLDFHDSFYPDNSGSLTIEVFAPAPDALWNLAFPLEAMAGGDPAVLVGFNTNGTPVLDASNPFLAEISAAMGVQPTPFLQLNIASYGDLLYPPEPVLPTVVGNRLDFPLDDGQGTTATLRIEITTSGGEAVDAAALAEFAPLPAPPSASELGFPPTSSLEWQSVVIPMVGGDLPGGTDVTMTIELLDDGGTPLQISASGVPSIGPAGWSLLAAALASTGIAHGIARRRRRSG